MQAKRLGKLKLGAFFHPTGNHVAAWLHPESQIDAGTNFQHYARLAKKAEEGLFDLMFVRDGNAVRMGDMAALSRWPQYVAYFEPTTLLAAIASLTHRIGLIATASTSFNEPYNIARRIASLDHISGGRAGWNVVTSGDQNESRNYGADQLSEHGDRYARANEFVEVVQGLWDSWEDDAWMRDRSRQQYFDPSKLHVLNHQGTYFRVAGPLNAARPPQGYPVIAQAGISEAGKELAARYAEVVFSPLESLERAVEFGQDLRGRMPKFNRHPGQLKLMPGLNPIIGATEAEAREKHEYLQSMIHPSVGIELLSQALGGIDLRGVDIDGPLPRDLKDGTTNASRGTYERVLRLAEKDKLTVRQLYMQFAGARGQRTLVGTPDQIADDMARWFHAGAVDGFLIQPAYLPGELDDFVDLVVPQLQDRGIFRTEYEGTTLRENLELDRPANRYAASPAEQGA